MVSTAALIAALQGQFSAARQGQGPGSNAGLPGLLAAGNGEGGNAINALASGGISGGGVPGTATTGASIASGLGGESAESLDPLTQQVLSGFSGFGNIEPNNPSGASLGEFDDLQGGSRDVLLSILSGNPLLMAATVAQAVSGQGVLADPFGGSFSSSQEQGREIGGNVGGPAIGGQVGQGAGRVGNIHGGVIGTGGVNSIRTGFSGGDSTPGASSRGGRELSRERTTGRASGPV